MPASGINSGDTAWLLVSTALVMLMTPGLALFYGGMVQRQERAVDVHALLLRARHRQRAVGGDRLLARVRHDARRAHRRLRLRRACSGVGLEPRTPRRPCRTSLFMMYQGMFAVITPALISGAFAERMKFSAYCLFTLSWATLVYDPLAHWVWATGGWLAKLGALDFAGGTVVHLSSGVSALVCAIVLGKRLGYPSRSARAAQPDDDGDRRRHPVVRLVRLQRAARRSASNGLAALAFVNTHLAAAAGALAWGARRGAALRQGDDARRRVGPGRRAGRHHAGGRLRLADGGDR